MVAILEEFFVLFFRNILDFRILGILLALHCKCPKFFPRKWLDEMSIGESDRIGALLLPTNISRLLTKSSENQFSKKGIRYNISYE